MEKRSILFVNDKDLSFKLKTDTLDIDRYVLDLVYGYEAGVSALSKNNYDLVISALKDPTLQAVLFSLAKENNFSVKTIAISSSSLDEFLSKIMHQNFSFNIIGGNTPLNLDELRVTVDKLFGKDIFGVNRYLEERYKSIELKINDSEKKPEVINEVIDFVRTFNRNERLLRTVSDIIDELIMNAIYDAPCDKDGKHLYSDADRTKKITLKKDEQVCITCGYDGRYLAVSVLDPFGSLDRERFVERVVRCSTREGAPIEIKPGGGGVGMYKTLESLSSLIVNLEPRKKTEVIAIVDLKWPMREFQKRYKSFHIFINREEIRMTEKLSTTRENLGDTLLVTFKGTFDENTFFGNIFETDKKKIRINLSGVNRINSCGVREWVNVIKEIPKQKKLEFVECSLPIVKQFNMISNFGGHGRVSSFIAPYFCPKCSKQIEKTIVISESFEQLLNLKAPYFSCVDCGGELEFDDLEDKYFQFILRQESKL